VARVVYIFVSRLSTGTTTNDSVSLTSAIPLLFGCQARLSFDAFWSTPIHSAYFCSDQPAWHISLFTLHTQSRAHTELAKDSCNTIL